MSATPSPPVSIEQLLNAVTTATAKDMASLRVHAATWLDALQQSKRAGASEGPRIAKGVYDRWVLDLFTLSETATPTDALLRGFVDRFSEVHELRPGQGPWAIMMEGYPPQGGSPWHFRMIAQAGMTDAQVRQFSQADWSGNALLQQVFTADTPPVDLWYLPYYRQTQVVVDRPAQPFEDGLFDAIFGGRRLQGVAVSGNAWLSATPLQDHHGRIQHAVFLLYPNRGGLFEVGHPPAGAPQDRRALDILAPVYKQLSGQIHRLADLVERIKRDIVAQIGMGLLNHEVGGLARVLMSSVKDQATLLNLVEERYGDLPPEMTLLKRMLQTQAQHAEQLKKTTHAFNSLERRGKVQEFELQNVFDEVSSLTRVRCGEVGVHLVADAQGLRLHNDATMLLHALLNLVINALNAFEEADAPLPLREIRLRAGWVSADLAWIEAANTGPTLDPDLRPRLFQRGATSRKHGQGHGLGLYLVRQIAQYCGGEASCPQASAPEAVVFRITTARLLNTDTQLGLLSSANT